MSAHFLNYTLNQFSARGRWRRPRVICNVAASTTHALLSSSIIVGTCVIQKVSTHDNTADIGTKRLNLPLFQKFAFQLVDRTTVTT